ncbi:unnamed protein product [Allacma fusca]|uniref:Translocation protein SEC62 n=1 Tax=Allacma fusca TaxID=39272 RepID=A0A8J2JTX1_9HEXA|nr:unnamed protein product [Allacma fusca]
MSSDLKQRKQKKRKEPRDEPAVPAKDEPSKEEYKIARWMRKNIPTKKTKFLSHTVEYFTACKAVDQLLDSPWAKAPSTGEDPLFTTRESVVDYMDIMLRHKMFHRARKIVVPENELKKKKKDKEKESVKDKESTKKEEKEDKKEELTVTAAESSQAEGEKGEEKKGKKKEEGEKKKRKIRLDMHLEQCFVDGLDAYVWIYEPTPYYYYFFGFLVVVAVIAVCLFPLWPSSVRQGVYYLSLAAAGFLVFILALAVIRLVAFCVIWGVTFGRHHLWLLPNLTEDVGFFASFWPLYKYEYKGNEDEPRKNKTSESESKKSDNDTQQLAENEQSNDLDLAGEGKNSENSETESEGSQKSQTVKT